MIKKCTVCKGEKPLDCFYNYKRSKDGKAYRCKICDDEARKRWKQNNPKTAHRSQRNRNLKHKYGVDIDWYDNQLKRQKGGCGICGIKENKASYGVNKSLNFSVDHCHETDKVRGLLCNNCNRALGLFGDDVKVLESALVYLTKVGYGDTLMNEDEENIELTEEEEVEQLYENLDSLSQLEEEEDE